MAYPGEINNFEPWEGSVDGTFLVVFSSRPKLLIITNDSTSANLEFRFNTAIDSWGTIKPTESVNLEVGPNQVQLRSTTSVDYRVWGFF
jgi:hypothetical protein